MNVAVLVSGEGTNLQALIDRVHGRGAVDIVAVASNKPGARGLERAVAAGIESGLFPRRDHADRAARDAAMGDWLDARGVELVVLAGFMELLSDGFVRRYAGRIVNVHPSLLPAFPGVGAIEQALVHGVRVTGVTVHFVDEGIDTGAIIMQRAFELPYAADIAAVEAQVHQIEHELLPHAVELIASGRVRFDPATRRVEVTDVGH